MSLKLFMQTEIDIKLNIPDRLRESERRGVSGVCLEREQSSNSRRALPKDSPAGSR